MSKRLIKITNTKLDTQVKWWWEAWQNLDDIIIKQSAKSYEDFFDILNPNRSHHAYRLIRLPSENSLECHQYWYFDSLPDPAPKFLLDWYLRENRRMSLQIIESSDQQIKSYIWWSLKYRQENNILISDIEVVNSNEVDVWPSNA